MKKNSLLTLILILLIGHLSIKSQPWKGNNSFLEKYLQKINYDNIDSANFIFYRVPLKFWVYTKSDGSGNLSDQQIKEFIQNLNYFHRINKTGFVFYLSDIEYIRSNKHNILGYYLEAPRLSFKNKQPGVINVHIAGNIKQGHGTVRGTYNKISKSILVKQFTSKSSLTHEVGHYFGLLHTHRNYNKGKGRQEAVDRNREFHGKIFKHGKICETSGDKLCDTPAEPRLSRCVSRNCKYTGKFTDHWGDVYKPDVTNIMGYPAYRKCRTRFSRDQIAAMLYTASKNKSANYWRTQINGKPFNFQYRADKYEPDYSSEMATRIKNGETQYHSFNSYFTGKKNQDKIDSVDYIWFRIDVGRRSNMKIKITTAHSMMPPVKISVFDKNNRLIKEQKYIKRVPFEFIINKLSLQDYSIEIKNLGQDRFSDYNVSLFYH